ncbi:hypothetical protein OX459_15790 [Janthinobacterium sp. SUN026]|uniref:hypothetical protein n=1 Tax=Janthinobacterium sp. SUN026 TaxID=3002438 RepID=UPI0025B0D18F|nr:hypothetical protein [Janthinobacterium sp. SUN026]MDN2672865.1 hypothetical protein [Janthinobacterium sp. SUN026]
MAFGSVQLVRVCAPVATSAQADQVLCPSVSGQFYAPGTAQAYLIDPSQQGIIEASIGPFDYAQAAGLWSAAFSMVVGLYFVSTAIGSILSMIRRG